MVLTGAVVGAALGAGVVLLALALLPPDRPVVGVTRPASLARTGLALGTGGACWAGTGWPVAGVLGAGAVLGLPVLFRGDRPAKALIARLEALAAWTEMLRDTMAGAAGLTQAILASGEVAPAGIAQEVEHLVARLVGRSPLSTALRAFADEMDDPAADAVVAALLLSTEARAGQLGDVLVAISRATREDVAMRRRVEASRARAWATTRIVAGVSIGFLVLASLGARNFLVPYQSVTGQAVLSVVGLVFAAGLWLMASMVRPQRPERLLHGGSR
ncbi:MAG TPA: type II secretion system F family protein [Acidimicrobiales bacterium]|nr:type II secretion system F family protein [Acidimicrobiales bacterium]